jgi:hypothetical protein
MNFFERQRRVALGFLEHIGTISIARYRNQHPPIDWGRLMHEWDSGEGGDDSILRRLEPDVPGLLLSYFACHGTLPLHVDSVGPGNLTFGAIVHTTRDLELDADGESVGVDPGAIFLLDPTSRHGAKADGSFVFATMDLPSHEAPTAEKFRRRVSRDLRRIAARHPMKEKQ